MGVYIKGMEMPQSCLFCWLNSMKQCRATGGDTTWATATRNRRGDCPLIEIPEPHGRLGDLDALKDLYHYNTHDSDIDKAWTCNIRRSLDNAPTIIPASGGGET